MRILIIGGGIGGLCAGIALAKAGHEVRVFERAPEPREVGAGIGLWPSAIKGLRQIGVRTVEAAGEAAGPAQIRTWRGRVLLETEYSSWAARLGAPLVMIHRADLLDCLLNALGREHVTFGHELSSIRQDGATVEATFTNGAGAAGDLLIGADGVRSRVRAFVRGEEPVRYSGQVCWRGVCEFPTSRIAPGYICESWGLGRRSGIARIGRGKVYWWTTRTLPSGGRDTDAQAELLRAFGDWFDPVPDLIRATPSDRIHRDDLFDRAPVRGWSKGAVTLLGDAAHAMTPNLGHGGTTAIEDGVVLAKCLAEFKETASALGAYEERRGPRTSLLVRRSRSFGAAGQSTNPAFAWLRNAALRVLPVSVAMRSMYGFQTYEP